MELKLLSCPLCLKPHFHGVDSLRASLISVATSHLSCPVCNETLLGLDKLTIHLFSHVNTNDIIAKITDEVSTPTASTPVPTSVPTNHNKGPESKYPLAPQQDEIDQTADKEVIVQADDDSMKCDICNFNFTDKNLLEMHQKLLHQTIPDKVTGLYSYHCHLCSKQFKKRGSLMVHLRVAHYGFGHHNPDIVGSPSGSQSVRENAKTGTDSVNSNRNGISSGILAKFQDNKQWECEVCSKMFTTKYFLKKHKRLHTGEMPYFCAQCNKSFTFQQSYHKHMLYHSSEKPYMCNQCGRAFKELSTLQNHSRIHSGERPFGCETCGKKFRQRVSYLVHQRIHTGIMPYKCTACDKCFRYKVSQRSHKCPMNPPGCVIRVADTSDKIPNVQETAMRVEEPNAVDLSVDNKNFAASVISVTNKCIMSVDYNTGTINFIQTKISDDEPYLNNNNLRLMNSSVQPTEMQPLKVSRLEETEKILGGLVMKTSDESLGCSEVDPQISIYPTGQPDLYSMVLSPLLPEVESLCLTNSSVENAKICDPESPENSFKNLFPEFENKL